ncbi:hypothetical protein SK128_002096 [Halocaridina rubra]|uniref:Uncharacterized protein n=1 Tax=Halocaridina rubra TaxID=373956 RepID=A0AAN8XD68_HALRR
MLSTDGHKAVALTVMFFVTLSCSMLALYVRNLFYKHVSNSRAKFILSGCLCFGAGVLMSTVFLHILPENRETFQTAMEENYLAETEYPIAEIMMCVGFFVVYFIEETVHTCLDRHHYEKHHHNHSDMQITQKGPKTSEEAKANAKKLRATVDRCSELRDSFSRRSVISLAVFTTDHGQVNHGYDGDVTKSGGVENGSPEDGSQTKLQGHAFVKDGSLVSTAMAVIALCFHGLMEGMSLGLEEEYKDVWILFGALSAHKIFLSFSMSIELLELGVPLKPFLLTMFIFAMASPVGGLIGALVAGYTAEHDNAASVLAPAFLQSISGGTILYVTFCEVLERERAKEGGGHMKLCCLVLGFGVLAGLETVGGHHHGHPANETLMGEIIT